MVSTDPSPGAHLGVSWDLNPQGSACREPGSLMGYGEEHGEAFTEHSATATERLGVGARVKSDAGKLRVRQELRQGNSP